MTMSQRNTWLSIIVVIILIILGVWWFTKPAHAPVQNSETTQAATSPLVSPAMATMDIKLPQQIVSSVVTVSSATTVADALQQVAQDKHLDLQTKDYGPSLGLLVTGMNGVTNDTKANTYWYFTVNGQLSQTGASTTTLKPGDRIVWQYGIVPTPQP